MQNNEASPTEIELDPDGDNLIVLAEAVVPKSEPEIAVAEFDDCTDSTEQVEIVTNSTSADSAERSERSFLIPPPIQKNLDNIAAKGGAVGAMVLGVWSLAGAFITSWSVVNALLGLTLGLWGLSSRHSRWAAIGIGLCAISMILCFYGSSEFVFQSESVQTEYSRGADSE